MRLHLNRKMSFRTRAYLLWTCYSGGCDAQCISVNMPCTGCGGPCPNVTDQGAAMISALASILGPDEKSDEIFDAKKLVDQVKDPIGTFYKYSLPSAILNRRIRK